MTDQNGCILIIERKVNDEIYVYLQIFTILALNQSNLLLFLNWADFGKYP